MFYGHFFSTYIQIASEPLPTHSSIPKDICKFTSYPDEDSGKYGVINTEACCFVFQLFRFHDLFVFDRCPAARIKQARSQELASKSTAAMKGPRCVVSDCQAVASRAEAGSTEGLFCARHAEPDMVNVINWTECTRDGCDKVPTYGERGTNNREFCAEHALCDMVDVHRKKCTKHGCAKRASHGVKGSGRRQFCEQHATVDMCDAGQKFCRFSSPMDGDCESIARYGIRGSKTREFCARHTPEGMVNMNDKLCIHGDCPKLPTYGKKGSKVRAPHVGFGLSARAGARGGGDGGGRFRPTPGWFLCCDWWVVDVSPPCFTA